MKLFHQSGVRTPTLSGSNGGTRSSRRIPGGRMRHPHHRLRTAPVTFLFMMTVGTLTETPPPRQRLVLLLGRSRLTRSQRTTHT
eukprot:530065-Lingulodinium_polyedra.AAC.1